MRHYFYSKFDTINWTWWEYEKMPPGDKELLEAINRQVKAYFPAKYLLWLRLGETIVLLSERNQIERDKAGRTFSLRHFAVMDRQEAASKNMRSLLEEFTEPAEFTDPGTRAPLADMDSKPSTIKPAALFSLLWEGLLPGGRVCVIDEAIDQFAHRSPQDISQLVFVNFPGAGGLLDILSLLPAAIRSRLSFCLNYENDLIDVTKGQLAEVNCIFCGNRSIVEDSFDVDPSIPFKALEGQGFSLQRIGGPQHRSSNAEPRTSNAEPRSPWEGLYKLLREEGEKSSLRVIVEAWAQKTSSALVQELVGLASRVYALYNGQAASTFEWLESLIALPLPASIQKEVVEHGLSSADASDLTEHFFDWLAMSKKVGSIATLTQHWRKILEEGAYPLPSAIMDINTVRAIYDLVVDKKGYANWLSAGFHRAPETGWLKAASEAKVKIRLIDGVNIRSKEELVTWIEWTSGYKEVFDPEIVKSIWDKMATLVGETDSLGWQAGLYHQLTALLPPEPSGRERTGTATENTRELDGLIARVKARFGSLLAIRVQYAPADWKERVDRLLEAQGAGRLVRRLTDGWSPLMGSPVYNETVLLNLLYLYKRIEVPDSFAVEMIRAMAEHGHFAPASDTGGRSARKLRSALRRLEGREKLPGVFFIEGQVRRMIPGRGLWLIGLSALSVIMVAVVFMIIYTDHPDKTVSTEPPVSAVDSPKVAAAPVLIDSAAVMLARVQSQLNRAFFPRGDTLSWRAFKRKRDSVSFIKFGFSHQDFSRYSIKKMAPITDSFWWNRFVILYPTGVAGAIELKTLHAENDSIGKVTGIVIKQKQ